jgi:hypothetical protein
MSLRHKPIDKITEDELEALVKNQIPEGKTIDYKRDVNDKYKEFAKDVTSFANTIGGDIVFGIEDDNGMPKQLIGLPGINAEQEITKFHQWMQAGIEPKVPGVVIRPVELPQVGGIAIIVRVPKSWAAPHMVTAQDDYRFWWRHDKGKLMMSVSQVRDAFVFAATVIERIRSFRSQRIDAINRNTTPIKLNETAKIVLHSIPLQAFDPGMIFDLSSYSNPRGPAFRFNLDGIVFYSEHSTASSSFWYQQVFRNGIIEYVRASLLTSGNIPSQRYEDEIIAMFEETLTIQRSLKVEPPIYIMLSLLGVNGYKMGVHPNLPRRYPDLRQYLDLQIDRDEIIVPEIMIDKFDQRPAQVLRPLFDVVWNSTGWPRSMNYDKDGNRIEW